MSRRFVIDPNKPFYIFDTAGDWQATKLGELYTELAKETYKPFESAFGKMGR